jgi:integrase
VELLASYTKHLKAYHGLGPESEFHRFRPVCKAFRALYGPEPAIQFGPLQYKALRAHIMLPITVKLKDGRKVVRTRSRTYINMLMKHVRRLFRWASSEGMLPASVHEALKTVDPLKMGRTTARETEPVKPIGPEAVEATLKHLPPVVADMVRLQQLLACRPGEVCKITPGTVDRTNDVWVINLAKHKNAWRGRTREIFCAAMRRAETKNRINSNRRNCSPSISKIDSALCHKRSANRI